MFNWFPIEFYSPLYYHLLLFIVLGAFVSSLSTRIDETYNLSTKDLVGKFLLLFIVLYIGLRPINGVFVDMTTYAKSFQNFSSGGETQGKDIGFEFFIKFCSYIMPVELFFLICAIIYVLPLYLTSRNLFQQYWFYSFLMLVCSFSFWNYGVNGIRNGLATSIMLFGLTSRGSKPLRLAIICISISFHTTMLLPLGGFMLTFLYNNTKKYIYIWLLCIPISLVSGEVFETFIGNLGFDDRIASYLIEGNTEDVVFSGTGFRWDFLVYSSLPLITGWYFIHYRKFNDVLYCRLFNTYVIANSFWILVIRASFSNRFAYLSWFIMGLIIIFPLLTRRFFGKQHLVTMTIIFLYFLFTYFMNVIL